MNISWQDPPPSGTGVSNRGRKRSKYWDVLDELSKHPGKWAIVEDKVINPTGGLYSIVRYNKLPFEVTTRKNPDGTFAIFARKKETSAKEESL